MVIWFLMIRPHSFDWQPTGEVTAEIKTLMSNSTVIGAPEIKAVVVLESGKQTIISVPIRSNIRAGDPVILREQTDQNNDKRKRYYFARLP
jgi:hypothetical protein